MGGGDGCFLIWPRITKFVPGMHNTYGNGIERAG